MKYRIEVWINDGSAYFEKYGTNKRKLLKDGMALVKQCHTPRPGYSSSVTLYKDDTIIRDCFLINDKTNFKHLNNE